MRDAPGLFKLAFVEDPWGTRIEVVQDPELLGLHHIHMRGPDPEAVFTWLQAKLGGERTKLKGRLDGWVSSTAPRRLQQRMQILVQRGDAAPRVKDMPSTTSASAPRDRLGTTIDGLRAKGVTVTSEPRPLAMANGPGVNFSYVAGPDGARIEIVERPGLKPGE